jgi:nicotinamide mononucleotide (NMN) deamidase PncC
METVTGGHISSEFNKCTSPAKHLISQGLIINNPNQVASTLNCNPQVFSTSGFVSVESTYELASALLESRKSDLVLVTCGDIDSDSHVNYIAVGDSDGIHVYKNTCIGTKDQIIETVSKCAVFYLIKKLKQNDLFFNKIRV